MDAVSITTGHTADLCIFDLEARSQVIPAHLKSQVKDASFLGYEMQGAVTHTFVDGQVVFEAPNE